MVHRAIANRRDIQEPQAPDVQAQELGAAAPRLRLVRQDGADRLDALGVPLAVPPVVRRPVPDDGPGQAGSSMT
jgi:hypothetical protein